jgi:hypothetical protein
MNKRLVSGAVIALALLTLMLLFAWKYTHVVIANARAQGEYASAEEGMLALMDESYSPDHTVKIYSAGPDAHDGRNPYVWYVIAEVRASSRADGSQLGHNGCDAPGTFFVQLKDGKWVHVPEGLFILFVPSWLDRFGFAGKGQSTPTTDLIEGPMRFCQ